MMGNVGREAGGEEAATLEKSARRRLWPPLSRARVSLPSPLGGLRLPNLNMPRSILQRIIRYLCYFLSFVATSGLLAWSMNRLNGCRPQMLTVNSARRQFPRFKGDDFMRYPTAGNVRSSMSRNQRERLIRYEVPGRANLLRPDSINVCRELAVTMQI